MKLTMITIRLRNLQSTMFVKLKPCKDGKTRLSMKQFDDLCLKAFGFTAERGETISIA